MARCSKTKCPNNNCGPTGIKAVKKIIKSPTFLTYYLLVFFVFITLRVYQLPYGNKHFCKLQFAVFSLIQWIVFYLMLFITILFLEMIINVTKTIISWIQKFIKKRSKKTIWDRIWVVLIKICVVIVLLVLIPVLLFLIQLYTIIFYYGFGMVMGYTLIGSKNNCIVDKTKT